MPSGLQGNKAEPSHQFPVRSMFANQRNEYIGHQNQINYCIKLALVCPLRVQKSVHAELELKCQWHEREIEAGELVRTATGQLWY